MSGLHMVVMVSIQDLRKNAVNPYSTNPLVECATFFVACVVSFAWPMTYASSFHKGIEFTVEMKE